MRQLAGQTGPMMANSILATVGGGYEDGNGLALASRQAILHMHGGFVEL
jgi:hypothetical protein